MQKSHSLRIAWCSPLTTKSCLRTSEYTKQALSILSEKNNIELFLSDEDLDELSQDSFQGVSAYHYHWLTRAHAREAFDLFVYQIENHPRANFVKNCLVQWPGLTFFHDTNLNRIYFDALKHSTGGTDFNKEMDTLFGTSSIRFGDWHVRGWPLEILDCFYIRGLEELKQAGAISVFSERMKDEVRHLLNDQALISIAPSLFSISGDVLSKRNSSSEYTIGVSGVTTLEDRALQILESFLFVKKQRLTFKVIWLVHDEFEKKKIEETLSLFEQNEEGVKELITVEFVHSISSISKALESVDVFLSLSHSPRVGPSLSLQIASKMDLPIIASDTGPGLDVLSESLFRVGLGSKERGILSELLCYFVSNNVRCASEVKTLNQSNGDVLQSYLNEFAQSLSPLVAKKAQALLAAKDLVIKAIKEQTSSLDFQTIDSKYGIEMVETVSEDFKWDTIA